jgi:acyl-CoA dehydrogenase
MSDIADMIAESVNKMFSEMVNERVLNAAESGVWPAQLWQAVEDSGFTKVLASESEDEPRAKLGNAWANAYPLFQAAGYHRVPLPLSETVIGAGLLWQAGMPVPDGPLSVIQQQPDDDLQLTIDNDRLVLNGRVAAVPWARVADAIVIAGRVGRRQVLGLVARDAGGVAIGEACNIAGEPRDEVHFDRSRCSAFVICDSAIPEAPVMLYAALARAAMMAGAAQSVLHQSVRYANERTQFGRPLGKFQAIQQSLAILAGEVAAAQTAALAACDAADAAPRLFDVAVAKIRAGQAASLAANIAHQVHGAIGFTHEHSLHHATRRLWSWRAEFGAESAWAEQLGREAIQAGGNAFWSDLTASQSAHR